MRLEALGIRRRSLGHLARERHLVDVERPLGDRRQWRRAE
jgi:hypothetical protein